MKNLLKLVAFAMISTTLFSCSTTENSGFAKRKYLDKHWAKKQKFDKSNDAYSYDLNSIKNEKIVPENAEATVNVKLLPKSEVKNIQENSIRKEKTIVATKTTAGPSIKTKSLDEVFVSLLPELKTTRKSKTSAMKPVEVAANDMMIIKVICAIFIPPLAVYLHESAITTNFWIDLLLTLLFWLPGIIFAFLIILDVI